MHTSTKQGDDADNVMHERSIMEKQDMLHTRIRFRHTALIQHLKRLREAEGLIDNFEWKQKCFRSQIKS